MSNEMKCNVLIHGPENEVAAFTGEFARDQFQAHLPIPPNAEPRTSCEPLFKSRRLAQEYWGTRFIYQPRPGISILRGVPPIVEHELRRIEQENYEGYRLPNPDNDAIALITFGVPTDPPARWADHVIRNYFEHGLRFMFRWWDQDNYHRCQRCGALDGICLRAGAFWSIEDGDHSTYWCGETRCLCSGEHVRVPRTKADDEAMVSMTAFVDGSAIRVVSTHRTGRRVMVRYGAKPQSADRDQIAQEINDRNDAMNPANERSGRE